MTLDPETRFALLVYDIPSNIKLRNPSMLLRRWGARINLSCWVLPMGNLALLPLKEWVEKGATVEVVEFGEHEREKVVALARRAIMRDIEETRGFIEAVIENVRKRLKAAMDLPLGSQERIEAVKLVENYQYAALWRAKAIADAAEEAALHFDISGDVDSLADALRAGIKAKSALFYTLKTEATTGLVGSA
jgi:hypothetical protein